MRAAVKPARAARRVVAKRGGGGRNAAADARAAITRCTECRISASRARRISACRKNEIKKTSPRAKPPHTSDRGAKTGTSLASGII